MTSILYNTKYGGYGLSPKACDLYRERTGTALSDYEIAYRVSRSDQTLVAIVKELGAEADGSHARLAIAEVPAGTHYRIDEYDGKERVMTIADYEWDTA